jgi:predicted acylesterase/phospholipase RssA
MQTMRQGTAPPPVTTTSMSTPKLDAKARRHRSIVHSFRPQGGAKHVTPHGCTMSTSPRDRVSLRVALGSGALRGAYQYGFFKTLESLDANVGIIHFDKVHGASIGAFNAPFVAAKKAYVMQSVWEADDPMRAIMVKEDCHSRLPALGLTKQSQCLALVCLRGYWFRGFDVGTVQAVWTKHDMVVPEEVDVRCVSFEVTRHQEVWCRIHDLDSYIEHVQKSAALPVVLPPHIVGGRWFIDGGSTQYVPLGQLYDPDFQGLYLVFDNSDQDDSSIGSIGSIGSNGNDDVGNSVYKVLRSSAKHVHKLMQSSTNGGTHIADLPPDRTLVFRPVHRGDEASIFGTSTDVATWIRQGTVDAQTFYEDLTQTIVTHCKTPENS